MTRLMLLYPETENRATSVCIDELKEQSLADLLAGEFYPLFSVSDLINLPSYHIYLKLMIDGNVSQPFSAITINEMEPGQRDS